MDTGISSDGRHRRGYGISGDNRVYGNHIEGVGTPMDSVACRVVYPRRGHHLQVERQIDASWRIRPIFEEGMVVVETVVSLASRERMEKVW